MPLGTRKFLAGKGSGATDDLCIIDFNGSSSSGLVNFCRYAEVLQDPAGFVLNVRNYPDEFTDPNYPAVVILRAGITYKIRWGGVGQNSGDCLRSEYNAINSPLIHDEKGSFKITFGQGRDANGYTTPIWSDQIDDTIPDNLYPLQYKFTNITFPKTIQESFTVTTTMRNDNQGLYGNYYVTSGGNPNGGKFRIYINEAF